MLKSITIKDFKCHEYSNIFNFPGLTYLSGANNSGKTSVLQSILLLAQSNLNNFEPTLLFNAGICKLGSFTDVLNKNTSVTEPLDFSFELNNDEFEFLNISLKYKNPELFNNKNRKAIAILSEMSISCKHKNYEQTEIKLLLKDENNLNLKENIYHLFIDDKEIENSAISINGFTIIPSLEIILGDKKNTNNLKKYLELLFDLRSSLSLVNARTIKYLRAYRAEAKSLYDITGVDSSNIGKSGEYTPEVLHRNMEVKKQVYFGELIDFKELFTYWCSKILGENYKVYPDEFADFYKLKVEEISLDKKEKINVFDITQVGFGFSQVIPIITMILLSKENDVLLIENPEVHLHPKLQANLAELFVFAVKHDRKIIVETHSEHIINRTRLEVKSSAKEENLKDKINIYFFEKDFDDNESFIKSEEILIDENGKISSWPKNFFDQSYNDSIGLI